MSRNESIETFSQLIRREIYFSIREGLYKVQGVRYNVGMECKTIVGGTGIYCAKHKVDWYFCFCPPNAEWLRRA